MMKILQINCVFKNGSTGKIVYDIHTFLSLKKEKSIVCYGRGRKIKEPGIYKTCEEWYAKLNNLGSRFTGIMYGGCKYSTKNLISIIKRENPDIVHLHCINGYFVNIYVLLDWLKKNKKKTILTLHSEFMYTGGGGDAFECKQWNEINGCGYKARCPRWRLETKSIFFDRTQIMWKKMKGAFEAWNENILIVSVSPWLLNRAMNSPILKQFDHRLVMNGLDCSVFYRRVTEQLRIKHNITNEKIILYVTPFFNTAKEHIKGGYYIIELAKKLKNKNIKIFVAGAFDNSIEVPSNIVLLGKILDQKVLAEYYSISNITLLTSKKETFSMVTAESLCCGTPVVGFKAGAPEQIAIPEYSEFVEYGDLAALESAIEKWMDVPNRDIISKKAIKAYNREKMCSEYYQLYLELLQQRGE